MFGFTYISAFSFVVFLVIGMYTLCKNRNKSAVMFYFALLLISISFWCLGNYQADAALTGDSQILWSNVALIAAYFGSALHICFSYALRGQPVLKKSAFYLIISLCTIPLLFAGIGSYHSPVISYTQPGTVELGFLALVYLLFFFVTTIHTIIILLSGFAQLSDNKKSQIIWVLSGLMVMKIGAVFFSIILPLLGHVEYYSATPLASYAALFCIAVAITKHEFLEFKMIIQRGAIYIVLFGFFSILSLLLVSLFTQLFSQMQWIGNYLGIVLTVLLGLWLLPIADVLLRKITNGWFFKEQYDYFEASSQLFTICQKEVRVKNIINEYLACIQSIIPHQYSAIFSHQQNRLISTQATVSFTEDVSLSLQELVGQPDSVDNISKKLQLSESLACVFPILFDGKPVALLLLGNKKSEEKHSSQDLMLIRHSTEPLAVALEKAHLYDLQISQSQKLEDEVSKRTATIKNLQEAQEKTMLDISHSLQTPLTILSMESQALPHKAQLIIGKTVAQISHSIKDILHLARLEQVEDGNNNHAVVNLSALCELLTEYFSEPITNGNFNATCDIADDCFILGHYEQIEEVLVNLIENAIKYMPEQEVKNINFQLEKKEDQAIITISDNGLGIPVDEQKHVFDRFFRSTRNAHIPGTGLGLAICHEIIQNHHGGITVSSSDNETIFTVTLPLHKMS